MKVIIIAAIAKNMVIGKDNDLVWHLPTDMKFFKDSTRDAAVLMGRKNYESIPERFRPLPKRRNIVVSRREGYAPHEDVAVFADVESGIAHAKAKGEEKLFIIGGGQIYAYVLEHRLADSMYLTWIDEEFKGDTYFPTVDEESWHKKTIFRNKANDTDPYDFDIIEYSARIVEPEAGVID